MHQCLCVEGGEGVEGEEGEKGGDEGEGLERGKRVEGGGRQYWRRRKATDLLPMQGLTSAESTQ